MGHEQDKLQLLPLLPRMVQWYGPRALAQTGLRTVISGLFGQYADQRVLQAALDTSDEKELAGRYDYSKVEPPEPPVLEADGTLWVDYVADVGDGFDSTFAIASLLALPELRLEEAAEPLKPGRILIMGGDQVYPYASDAEYKRRFLRVYDYTVTHEAKDKRKAADRRLFLLPGNHDWYDGLAAFDELFCSRRDRVTERRLIGRWRCTQHRSYFSIRLPYNWWIWGIDTQLKSNLDVGQIHYFNAVAASMRAEAVKSGIEPRIIACLALPVWQKAAQEGTTEAYPESFERILNLAIDRGKVCAVVAGDWHHYSRYFGTVHRLNLFTAGGGGAYAAPTHHLPAKIDVPWRVPADDKARTFPFVLRGPTTTADAPAPVAGSAAKRAKPLAEALFPDRRTSRGLSWRLPVSPIRFLHNWSFFLGLGVFYWLITWLYGTAFVAPQGKALLECQRLVAKRNEILSKIAQTGDAAALSIVAPAGEQLFNPAQCSVPVLLQSLLKPDLTKAGMDKEPVPPITAFWNHLRDIPFDEHLHYVVDAGINQFALALLGIAVLFALYAFSGARRRWLRFLDAGVHWLVHLAAMVLLYVTILYWMTWIAETTAVGKFLFSTGYESRDVPLPPAAGQDLLFHLLIAATMVLVGGFVAGSIFGVYLFLSNRVFRTQHDNAYSALRIADYKHFLRLRITPNELTIFPIGLRRVPRRNEWRRTKAADWAKGVVAAYVPKRHAELKPHLIEGPIVIRPGEVKNLQAESQQT